MTFPALGSAGQEAYDRLEPVADRDAENGYALAWLCAAFGAMFDDVNDLVRDRNDRPGWAIAVDVDETPSYLLPWLAQFVGVTLTAQLAGETDLAYDARMRDRIKSTDGFRRGSPGAVIGAVQQVLTGTKKVYLTERFGSAYRIRVTTLASETPDPSAVLPAALKGGKPAGIVMDAITIVGGDYQTLRDVHSSYGDVKSQFADYLAVRADPSLT